ncbi:hypothetical protein ACI68E_002676 [Malassezia pachydermatis]
MSTWKVDVGPLLRYDTVDAQGVYHAFALIVTEHDANEQIRAPPMLQYVATAGNQNTSPPMQAEGLKLWVYNDETRKSHVFWRFKIEIHMMDVPQVVAYTVLNATELHDFHVPAHQENFRWAGYSCSGFSSSVDTEEYGGPDPLWNDLLLEHVNNKPFHILMGGGDQVYSDKIANQPELKNLFDPDKIKQGEDNSCFGQGAFARAAARIPMVNMLDDHDLIDGFGTYPDSLMESSLFNRIGSRGYFFYLLFQQFMNDELDGISNENTTNPNPSQFKSLIIGGPGAYIPFPAHSFLVWLGPKQHMLLLDCRAQRKLNQICTQQTYDRCREAMEAMPKSVKHLIVQLGVPISYPRMVFLEKMLASKYNPVVNLVKACMPAFTNNFNGQVELLDDLNDHWCAHGHKHERNRLVEQTQKFSQQNRVRVSFISGDVHAGGCGYFYSSSNIRPENDYKYNLALITSAIVNAPPPPAVIAILNKLAAKRHRSLQYAHTREGMIPMFEYGLDDEKLKQKYIIGARNWCAAEYNEQKDEIVFELRVEKAKGSGRVKSYYVTAPAPLF